MIEKISRIFLLLFFIKLFVFGFGREAMAATYHMNADGTEDCVNLQVCFDLMQGGDALIIRDGVYTGDANAISPYVDSVPPVGTPSNWTVIKAEHDGEVLFDGENTRWMFYIPDEGARYWQFEGLVWGRTTETAVFVGNASYIKFLRCGAFDPPNGNTSTFGTHSASHILYEGCYAYGSGRYKFISYLSDHMVYRNCVGRTDNIDTTGELNPSAIFSIYSSSDVEVQNCVAIDSDQDAHWVTNARQGAFFVPTTSGPSTNVHFNQNIGLNVKLGGIQVAANYSTENVTFEDVVIWDCPNEPEGAAPGLLLNLKGNSGAPGDFATHLTVGASAAADASWGPSWPSLTNSIFYRNTISQNFWAWGTPIINNYNSYYGNTNNAGRTGANDILDINPTSNSLKYITRIEEGSDLSGAGDDGSDIGANVLTLVGAPGTLWGEEGYDTDTGISMWPFPNEDLIKQKMAEYTWDSGDGGNPEITGARGFAAPGTGLYGGPITLSSYIWEYLGNPCPEDICVYGEEVSQITYNLSNFVALLSDWLTPGSSSTDIDNDSIVNARDLGIMMSNWGE